MGKQQSAIDLQRFERVVSLFAQKREALDPEIIQTIASDIVRRLARSVKPDQRIPDSVITDESVGSFCDALVQDDPGVALHFIDERRAEGVSRQDVYLGYIAAAAVMLGERWNEDLISLVDVTVATGHLYALMRSLRDEGAAIRPAFDLRKRAVFATVPGEDHGIGITIAADLFREAGWEIDLQIGRDHDGLMEHIEQTAPGVIGLSFSTERRLGELMRLVVAMRIAVPNAIIGVAPSASIDHKQLSNLVDIDLLFGDAASALSELDRLIRIPANAAGESRPV